MTATVWFLIVLAMFPDHVHLDQGPYPFPTQTACATKAATFMIDRSNQTLKVWCIEADDEFDLHIIMNENFNFGGQSV